MQAKIWHNPRCSKSRTTLALLEEKGVKVEIVHYLENTPNKTELSAVLEKLALTPRDIIRKGEAAYKENGLDKDLSDNKIIDILVNNPILIERPIVITAQKAAIGRPPENVLALF